MTTNLPQLSLLGTTALLFEAPGETTLTTQRRIWALALEAGRLPGVREAVPGMNNLMVTFAEPPRHRGQLEHTLIELWHAVEPLPAAGRRLRPGRPSIADKDRCRKR